MQTTVILVFCGAGLLLCAAQLPLQSTCLGKPFTRPHHWFRRNFTVTGQPRAVGMDKCVADGTMGRWTISAAATCMSF